MKKIDIENLNYNIPVCLRKGCLLTSGKLDSFNTMTIEWGNIGYLWRRYMFICYVKPIRYTYQFMEENDIFTISFYNDNYKKEIGYLGTHSGKNTDKVRDVDFHPFSIDGGVSFKESYLTIVCRKCYYDDIDEKRVLEDVYNRYYKNENPHRMYFGEIIGIYEGKV